MKLDDAELEAFIPTIAATAATVPTTARVAMTLVFVDEVFI
jgi:hypothetical protein